MTHLQTLLKRIIDRQLIYLDATYQAYTKTYQEVRGDKKPDEEFFMDITTRTRLTHLQYDVALCLDTLHQSFPDVYELFPDRKKLLDNVEILFRTYQQHKVLPECKCDYCISKDMPKELKEEPKEKSLQDDPVIEKEVNEITPE